MGSTVLLISEDGESRSILKVLLAWKGRRVVEANNVEEGLNRARTEGPDLLVTEFLLSRCSGHSVIDDLRLHAETASTPVIVFSTNPSSKVEEQANRAGGFFLRNPQSPLEVCQAIGRFLPRPESSE